ncbi:MAG: N-acetylmuramoyl-L-alanine amidase [Planctomycetes bacterium]|nr:N-acetylmuramoyl-L-alanine amidase [Planctomycetota bacterium]
MGLLVVVVGCASVRPGTPLSRRGDEIVVCGRLVHTGAPVVLWTDPDGYDAYRVMRRFEPSAMLPSSADAATATPNRYGDRPLDALSPDEQERVRDRGWDLPELQHTVHQFVLHYDVCGTSRECFRILHDVRGLSVHFLLDLDGTIYQTLDLKERARHASIANDRSVGVEIAQIGAYPNMDVLSHWYRSDETGRMRVVLPDRLGDGHQRTPGFVARPARDEPVRGEIHGETLLQYDFTPEQYESLERLAATLCRIFPEMKADVPRDATGAVRRGSLSPEELTAFSGILGHFHVTSSKTDPGPAFDWDRFIGRVRRILAPTREPCRPAAP